MSSVDQPQLQIPALPTEVLPPYVRTPAERARFEVCTAIATELSSQCEPDGRANSQFVWYTARHLYHSAIPTGSPEDPIPSAVSAT